MRKIQEIATPLSRLAMTSKVGQQWASGLKFKQSLKHRHSGMFLAGMTIKWGCSGVIVYLAGSKLTNASQRSTQAATHGWYK